MAKSRAKKKREKRMREGKACPTDLRGGGYAFSTVTKKTKTKQELMNKTRKRNKPRPSSNEDQGFFN